MAELADYIYKHTTVEYPSKPPRPVSETDRVGDVCFFQVRVAEDATAERLRELLSQHRSEYDPNEKIDLSQPGEYSYIKLGAWLGTQELALRLIGMGGVLGLWDVLSPKVFAQIFALSQEQLEEFAGQGFVLALVSNKPVVAK